MTNLVQDLREPLKHRFLVQLVAIKLQPLNQLLHRPFRLEGQQRETERNVPPLARLLRKMEPLAQLLDNALRLFFLRKAFRTTLKTYCSKLPSQ
jgi:hypothetical protein